MVAARGMSARARHWKGAEAPRGSEGRGTGVDGGTSLGENHRAMLHLTRTHARMYIMCARMTYARMTVSLLRTARFPYWVLGCCRQVAGYASCESALPSGARDAMSSKPLRSPLNITNARDCIYPNTYICIIYRDTLGSAL